MNRYMLLSCLFLTVSAAGCKKEREGLPPVTDKEIEGVEKRIDRDAERRLFKSEQKKSKPSGDHSATGAKDKDDGKSGGTDKSPDG